MYLVEELILFGLTRQEATIYLTLLEQGALTGYEAAKLTGISRSNSYNALAGLVEKGAAYVMEENVSKYCANGFLELSDNRIRLLQARQREILAALPAPKVEMSGYITIRGNTQIMDKLINMITDTEHRLYLSVPFDVLTQIEPYLIDRIDAGKRVVILADRPYALDKATVYQTQHENNQLRLIVDSHKVLSGQLSTTETSTCLYSLNSNLVTIFKEMLQNEITLIQLAGTKQV